MKRTLNILALLLLIGTACEKPDDVLPIPPHSNNSSVPVKPEENVEKSKPTPNVDSELFQYGEFGDMPYRILIPRDYDSARRYPLHIFLHGIGDRGSDNEKQLSVGAAHFQVDSVRNKYGAFIVFPQCPTSDYWFSRAMTAKLKTLVDTLLAHYVLDPGRISIGGFSMGAYGTFAMVARYPGLFDAAVVISGDGDPKKASLMAKPTWQLFAGQRDEVVPSNRTAQMATALARAGASVSFKLYPEADHGRTSTKAFSEPDFFHSLFAVRNETH